MSFPSCSRLARACALVFTLLLPVHDGIAQTPALSLPEAQRRAIERSRQLTAQDAAIAAARESAVAAGQLPDPVLRVGIDNLPLSGTDRLSLSNDAMTMRRIGVMQELTGADKRRLRTARVERSADKALAEKSVIAVAIERDTALAWLDLFYADAMAQVVDGQRAQAEMAFAAAEGAYRGGRGTQAELFAARSAVAAMQDRASEAARRVKSAATMLARWTGSAPVLPLAGAPDVDHIRLDPAALEAQLARQPQIAVLSRQQDIAEAEARLAQADKKADWSVEVAYQQRGPAYANMLSVGLSVPLQWDQQHRQNRELAARLAMVEQARAERDEALRARVAEVRTLLGDWESGRERLARYRRDLLPLASEQTEAVLAAYRGGKSSLADVLGARRNELEVRLQSLQLEADTARLWAQLNFLFPSNSLKDVK
jgi:outer membrane protein TolC